MAQLQIIYGKLQKITPNKSTGHTRKTEAAILHKHTLLA